MWAGGPRSFIFWSFIILQEERALPIFFLAITLVSRRHLQRFPDIPEKWACIGASRKKNMSSPYIIYAIAPSGPTTPPFQCLCSPCRCHVRLCSRCVLQRHPSSVDVSPYDAFGKNDGLERRTRPVPQRGNLGFVFRRERSGRHEREISERLELIQRGCGLEEKFLSSGWRRRRDVSGKKKNRQRESISK